MFGYVRPYKPSLSHADFELYRSVYCGVCRSLKRHTGALSTLSLNYDFVFLALVRLLVGDRNIRITHRRCAAHPLRRRPMMADNGATAYAARVGALLAYHKVRDDLRDGRFLGKLPPAALLPVLARARRRAGLTELDERIKGHLDELSRMERERVSSIDLPAATFGALMGDLFAYGAPAEYQEDLRSLGDTLGRFIYAADAADDFEADAKSGSYNPYVLTYGSTLTEEARRDIHAALVCTLASGEGALLRLPYGDSHMVRRLIENIMYEGLLKRVEFLLTGEKKRKRPKPYDGALP